MLRHGGLIFGRDMNIRVNGEELAVASGIALDALMQHMKICAEKVVVEYNRRILSAKEWAGICLKEGDALEVVSFVGGG